MTTYIRSMKEQDAESRRKAAETRLRALIVVVFGFIALVSTAAALWVVPPICKAQQLSLETVKSSS